MTEREKNIDFRIKTKVQLFSLTATFIVLSFSDNYQELQNNYLRLACTQIQAQYNYTYIDFKKW
jgi:hypothetical protein